MAELSAAEVQILLLEMQPPVVAAAKTVAPEKLRKAAATLRAIAVAAGVPITASVVPVGESPPRLIEELAGIEPRVRETVAALDDPIIRERLASQGRRILAVGGVSSEIALLHTVLAARAAGYSVHVLIDAGGGLDARTEQASLVRMWSAGALPSNISSFATEMIADMSSAFGRSIMTILDQHWGWS